MLVTLYIYTLTPKRRLYCSVLYSSLTVPEEIKTCWTWCFVNNVRWPKSRFKIKSCKIAPDKNRCIDLLQVKVMARIRTQHVTETPAIGFPCLPARCALLDHSAVQQGFYLPSYSSRRKNNMENCINKKAVILRQCHKLFWFYFMFYIVTFFPTVSFLFSFWEKNQRWGKTSVGKIISVPKKIPSQW